MNPLWKMKIMTDILKIKTLNKCKRLIAFALSILLLKILTFPLFVYAKSGRNDRDGGHYDYDTGTYAFYHGHSAHQHPNGICPYGDYDKYWDYYDNCPKSGYENLYEDIEETTKEIIKSKYKPFTTSNYGKNIISDKKTSTKTYAQSKTPILDYYIAFIVKFIFVSLFISSFITCIIIVSKNMKNDNPKRELAQPLNKSEKLNIWLFCSIISTICCTLYIILN